MLSRNWEVGSMGVDAGFWMQDVVVQSSRSLSHLLMSSCLPPLVLEKNFWR